MRTSGRSYGCALVIVALGTAVLAIPALADGTITLWCANNVEDTYVDELYLSFFGGTVTIKATTGQFPHCTGNGTDVLILSVPEDVDMGVGGLFQWDHFYISLYYDGPRPQLRLAKWKDPDGQTYEFRAWHTTESAIPEDVITYPWR